jgi:hypothetical protein
MQQLPLPRARKQRLVSTIAHLSSDLLVSKLAFLTNSELVPLRRGDGNFPRLAAPGMGGEGGGSGGGGNLQMSSKGGLPTHSAPGGGQQQQGQILLVGGLYKCVLFLKKEIRGYGIAYF